MRNKSHATMGRVLLREYMSGIPAGNARLFLLGCTQPDKNPATYIKGSLRSHWMRGHNYTNSNRFMMRLAMRLDGKEHFSPLGLLLPGEADSLHAGRFYLCP